MDEDSKELVSAVTEAGVRGFLTTIAAPLVETGDWGADLIRRRRLKTQIKTLVLAKEMLDAAGLPANSIAPRVLVPLLENASLADDPEEVADSDAADAMQTRWAALLANAAAGELGASVMAGFPSILAELDPVEAHILEGLVNRPGAAPLSRDALAMILDLPLDDQPARVAFRVHLENLERLGLCAIRRQDKDLQALASFLERERQTGLRGRPVGSGRLPKPQRQDSIAVTQLGVAFVRACTPPAELEDAD